MREIQAGTAVLGRQRQQVHVEIVSHEQRVMQLISLIKEKPYDKKIDDFK